MKRLKFTNECRPKDNDIIMLCTADKGHIYCGVINYPSKFDRNKDSISISMFVNDVETDGAVDMNNIRWWHLLPLTKEELWKGNAY